MEGGGGAPEPAERTPRAIRHAARSERAAALQGGPENQPEPATPAAVATDAVATAADAATAGELEEEEAAWEAQNTADDEPPEVEVDEALREMEDDYKTLMDELTGVTAATAALLEEPAPPKLTPHLMRARGSGRQPSRGSPCATGIRMPTKGSRRSYSNWPLED